jgi:hypothetical protein
MSLSEELFKVYGIEHLRHYAYVQALNYAAKQGKFKEMELDVMVFDKAGKKCEQLVEELDRRYSKSSVVLKQKAMSVFLSMKRGGTSLLEAVMSYKKALMECMMAGYHPDADTKLLVLQNVAHVPEMLAAESSAALNQVNAKDPEGGGAVRARHTL